MAIDLFSVEPPMLPRYAIRTQENRRRRGTTRRRRRFAGLAVGGRTRLLIPVEGTGYLDLLEYWRRDAKAKAAAAGIHPDEEPSTGKWPDNGRHPVTDPRQPPGMPGEPFESPLGPATSPDTGSPFYRNRRLSPAPRNASATGAGTWRPSAAPVLPLPPSPSGAAAPPGRRVARMKRAKTDKNKTAQ